MIRAESLRGRRPSGMSLLEVVVAVTLVAICLLFVVSLVPMSAITLKKGEDLQATTCYGLDLIEDYRANPRVTTGVDRTVDVEINRTTYRFVREIYQVDACVDVVVTATWPQASAPLQLTTRMRIRRR